MEPFATTWQRAPWTIKALAALSAIGLVTGSLIDKPDAWEVIARIAIGVLLLYGLLRGLRPAWVLLLIGEALAVFSLIGIAAGWFEVDYAAVAVAINAPLRALELFVLLHPLTRAWLRPKANPHPTHSGSSPNEMTVTKVL